MIPDIHPDGSSSKARRESDRSIDTLSQRFGDALLVSDGKGAEAIAMVRADTALYHAKHAGRNRAAVAGDAS